LVRNRDSLKVANAISGRVVTAPSRPLPSVCWPGGPELSGGRQGSLPVVVDARAGGDPPRADYKRVYLFETIDSAATKSPVKNGVFAWVVRGSGSPDLMRVHLNGEEKIRLFGRTGECDHGGWHV
jgi:hypothetical protein